MRVLFQWNDVNIDYDWFVIRDNIQVAQPIKVIPKKKKLPMNFLETFPECSLLSTVSKKTIKMIGHHSHSQ